MAIHLSYLMRGYTFTYTRVQIHTCIYVHRCTQNKVNILQYKSACIFYCVVIYSGMICTRDENHDKGHFLITQPFTGNMLNART